MVCLSAWSEEDGRTCRRGHLSDQPCRAARSPAPPRPWTPAGTSRGRQARALRGFGARPLEGLGRGAVLCLRSLYAALRTGEAMRRALGAEPAEWLQRPIRVDTDPLLSRTGRPVVPPAPCVAPRRPLTLLACPAASHSQPMRERSATNVGTICLLLQQRGVCVWRGSPEVDYGAAPSEGRGRARQGQHRKHTVLWYAQVGTKNGDEEGLMELFEKSGAAQ